MLKSSMQKMKSNRILNPPAFAEKRFASDAKLSFMAPL